MKSLGAIYIQEAPLGSYTIYIYIAIYAYMRMFHAYLWMFPSHLLPHQPTHIHPERGRRFAPPPQRGGRRFAPLSAFVDSFLDGCVWSGEAAIAMETCINMHETNACMHITRNSCGNDVKISCIYKYVHNSGPKRSPDMILTAFVGKFHDEKDELPPHPERGRRFAPPPPLRIPFWMDVCELVRQQMRWKHP